MPMTNEEFAKVVAELDAACQTLLDKKGADYTKNDNRLDNFEVVAALLQGAPMDRITVCAVYLLKQVISLCRYVRERTLESESLDSRFQDVRNYIALLYACYLATEQEVRAADIAISKLHLNAPDPTEEDLPAGW